MRKKQKKPIVRSGGAVVKRMHIVTQAYLSSFRDTEQGSKNSLWVFDKTTTEVRLQPIKDTAVIRRYYELPMPDGTYDSSLEGAFSQLESKAVPIIRRWCEATAVPSIEEIPNAAAFVACLFVRVPRTVEFIRAMCSTMASARIERLSKNEQQLRSVYLGMKEMGKLEDCLSFEEFAELTKDVDEKFIITTSQKYALALAVKQFDQIYKILVGMHWCLYDSRPFGGRFITCDAPVNVYRYENGKAAFGGGLSRNDVEVNLPLSPYVCLSLNWKRKDKVRKADAFFVMEVNKRTAYQADRYVYSSRNSRNVARFVEEGSVTTKLPRIDVEAIKQQAHINRKVPSEGK
jgi:hypothetical protein